jgi:uncharacterized protein (TIGR02246 family)
VPSVRSVVAGCIALTALGCSRVDLDAERAAILETDKTWLGAAQAKDLERTVSFWADDAVVMAPGQPALVGKDAIRKYVMESFKLPGFAIQWETTQVTVAPHGDVAYAMGTNTTTLNGPEGRPMRFRGKAATVWRKGADGSWKCVVDIWNDDAPKPSELPAKP